MAGITVILSEITVILLGDNCYFLAGITVFYGRDNCYFMAGITVILWLPKTVKSYC